MPETKCWSCKNACGNCSWSKEFKPVDGWIATKTFLINENEDSFIVHKCPEYIFDKMILTVEQISKLLNISTRHYYRLSEDTILKRLIALKYDVILTYDNKFILRGRL